MFRQALSEVRRHPGRFISTLLAIAISVAFLAGSATLVATEGQAQGKAMNVSLAQADVAIKVPEGTEVRGIGAVIGGQAGIAAYAPVLSTSVVVSAGAISQALQLVNVPPDSLRWAVITAGRWPQAADEIVLSAGAARALNVQVGQDLKPAGAEVRLKVVGLTNEPSGLFTKTGYASDAFFDSVGLTAQSAQQWAIKVAAGVQPSTVIAGLNP
ncbi:MAG: ABC transporter permease, partial [Actinobacteria bacterium]|nr:ABC transporter permease [Actinomycetota bacterium]